MALSGSPNSAWSKARFLSRYWDNHLSALLRHIVQLFKVSSIPPSKRAGRSITFKYPCRASGKSALMSVSKRPYKLHCNQLELVR